MRDYSKVGPQFWIGTTGKKLRAAGMDTQLLALYLMTSPHANMLGLYYCPLAFIAHETGLTIEGASEALRRAVDAGFCKYDEASEVVWVMEMATYQIGEALKAEDKRVKGVQNEYDALPENPYLSGFFEKYGDVFHMARCRKVAGQKKAPSKPLRSQEQEQEQKTEQEQEQEQENNHGAPLAVQSVFSYWQQTLNKPKSILTPKRERAVKAILKIGYTVEQVKQAIDGCKRSPFHQGVNKDRTVYDDLELICRDGEHLEKFINNIGAGSGVETIDMTRDRISAQAARVASLLEDAHP